MANVFNKIGDIKNSIKRNSFDWSHDNNFTTDIGRITPVFCELVPPNSSVRIKPTFGLRFMPMMFPIQTKMKAYMSFYKVPLRTLWKDYKDFISSDNTEEYEPPYMAFGDNDVLTSLAPSSLGDYFGIPTPASIGATVVNHTPVSSVVDPPAKGLVGQVLELGNVVRTEAFKEPVSSPTSSCDYGTNGVNVIFLDYTCSVDPSLAGKRVNVSVVLRTQWLENSDRGKKMTTEFGSCASTGYWSSDTPESPTQEKYFASNYSLVKEGDLIVQNVPMTASTTVGSKGEVSVTFGVYAPACQVWNNSPNTTLYGDRTFQKVTVRLVGENVNPYYDKGSKTGIKISAYPFRAYESVYNAYIRNNRNNPFVLNGKKTYNTFITNDAGGVDDLTPRELRYANWLSDAYTTALPSPQQGKAPLVGLTTYETVTLNEAGHEVTTINTAIVDEEGNAYKVDFESNGEALKGVNYTPLKAGEAINMQSLVSPVTSGISINDFRNVNAYQRYLELNQFRGFSYKDIIEGRFDVNVRYDALNMPEYLGGVTRDIIVNPITQTVETSAQGTYQGALGSQSGQAGVFGEGESVSVFCDEESIVLGLMWVTPMPVYDSILPKWLTYRSRLDSFNPEFDHIGYQPIYLSEVAPVQAKAQSIDANTVFGYQRPWYEYVQKVDRSHGLFLTSLRNFIMYRSFSDVPELGSEFTTVQPGQVNNVFSVTEISDKILGQIHFDCTAQLPISRVVVPRLE